MNLHWGKAFTTLYCVGGWGEPFQWEKVKQSFKCPPQVLIPALSNTQIHTHTNIPISVYVTCFPRRHDEQGHVDLLLLTFRISFPRTLWTPALCECHEAFPGTCEKTDLSCWDLAPANIYPRQNIRQTPELHRDTAGITPGLHFLPTPRSQP